MSGGHYDYKQYECRQLADWIARDIERNGSVNEWGDKFELDEPMLRAMRLAIALLEASDDLVHDIDWALSGDTSPEDMPRYLTKWLLNHESVIKDRLESAAMP